MPDTDPVITDLHFLATNSSGQVSAILMRPRNARRLLVFGHGAGAGMRHTFMETVCRYLSENGMATFRYQFPYMEQGKKAPNPAPILIKTVRSAVRAAHEAAADLPLIAGGKSLGGRMTSMAEAKEPLRNVQGLVFFGFPLHAPGRSSTDRAEHLFNIERPMLFLQGTRDRLADLKLLRPICGRLGEKATLHIIDGGDHSFHVPKRSGRTDDEVLQELAKTLASWANNLR